MKGLLTESPAGGLVALQINRPQSVFVNSELASIADMAKDINRVLLNELLLGTLDPSIFDRVAEIPLSNTVSGELRLGKAICSKPDKPMTSVATVRLTIALDASHFRQVPLLSLDVRGDVRHAMNGLEFAKFKQKATIIDMRKKDAGQISYVPCDRRHQLIESVSYFIGSDSLPWSGNHQGFLFVQRDGQLENARPREIFSIP